MKLSYLTTWNASTDAHQMPQEIVSSLDNELPSNCIQLVALDEILQLLDEQADAIDGRIPDATGGKFAKKFAANSIRACAGLIKQRYRV
jgi:hypothetical protein